MRKIREESKQNKELLDKFYVSIADMAGKDVIRSKLTLLIWLIWRIRLILKRLKRSNMNKCHIKCHNQNCFGFNIHKLHKYQQRQKSQIRHKHINNR